MSSSGSREVLEAARKRLASAKSQVSAASQHMKAVMASAQSMCDAADKEYKEAKAALEEAEKKYEVIDIDADVLSSSGQQSTIAYKAALSHNQKALSFLRAYHNDLRQNPDYYDTTALAGASYPSAARRDPDRGGYMSGDPRGMPFGGYSGDGYGGFGGGFPHPMNGGYHPYGYYH